MSSIIIIGAGLSGLSAAIRLAEKNIPSCLISAQPSERAQSVLAEGGINAALDTMGEGDTPAQHLADTLKGGVYLQDPKAAKRLADGAPDVVRWLWSLGVPFNTCDGGIMLRNFGGQKKKRTACAKSRTGKMIMSAHIDEVRKYESAGLVKRFSHHEFVRLITHGNECRGVRVLDSFTGQMTDFHGRVILCGGGMNGVFPEMTTGTSQNTGDITAVSFYQGVRLADPEMIQYHPTTVGICGKRCLVTEAARGEGGRLYILRDGEKWYFMEEKYPELKNLMPRDVVAREMFFVRRMSGCEGEVMLDLTGLSDDVWKNRLPDLRDELIRYLGTDPADTPFAVHEGIHYFMGGIDTDISHRTSMTGLYAAGECACQYHGANRLGGNSMLGAVFGGLTAADTAASENIISFPEPSPADQDDPFRIPAPDSFVYQLRDILLEALGIVRNETTLDAALEKLSALSPDSCRSRARLMLAKAMIISAKERRESRGAHYREDYPDTLEEFRKTAVCTCADEDVQLEWRDIPDRREVQ